MSAVRKPIPLSREPSGVITDGRATIGLIFDTAAGTVATLTDRVPLGTFAKVAEARLVIFEAWRSKHDHLDDDERP